MEHRSFRRPTFFDAVLRAESGEYSVKIRNVTSSGVNVTGLGGIVFPDTDVALVIRNTTLPGKVSWVNEDVAGVKLEKDLPKDLQTLITRGVRRPGTTGTARW